GMIKSCLLVFLILSFSLANAQTKINGRVRKKENGNVLPGVNVIVKEKNNVEILSYASTDETGSYQLAFTSGADSVVITIAGFNVKKQTKTVLNKSQMVNFTVTSETIQLKEIKIKAPNIQQINDTLNYNVDAFGDKNDRTIGDVLKKMPGIVVNEDGSITYNNKPITRFYIEDRDLLQGRYGIATNNIEAKDVATVQVLENHQPIKALKEREFTDAGAINLKLKDSAKGVLMVTGQLGTGLTPCLWNNELFSMLFSKKKQSLTTYKGNNSGKDASAELNTFYSGQEKVETGNTLSVQSPIPPPITRERYLFNRSNTISTNNLWTLGKDYQVNANINYVNDRQEKSSYSRSVYYLKTDSLLTIEESLAATEHINLLNAVIQLNTNKKNYYLDNLLNVTGGWNGEDGNVLSTGNIAQELNKRLYTLGNAFNLIKNFKKVNINIQSYNGYSSSPQVLKIQPFLYGNLFQNNAKLDLMRQTLIQNHFSSTSKFTLGLGNSALKQNYTVGVNLSLQNLHSDLQARFATGEYNNVPDSLRNQLQWNKYQLLFSSGYTYSKNKLKATVGFPLVYNYLYARDPVYGRADRNNSKLFFNPTLSLMYELNLFWNISAGASINNQLGEIKSGFTGYIM
ncbi:MAG: carboxypeptidase regulatory-like domain-containing protein, partial [Daejeonella sp.]|uniref:carboxypeptidase regulatory-like domain-containing protein n=1 Tax=Daejeonella sp. TaxID=2805397 RepID=UPI003C75703A